MKFKKLRERKMFLQGELKKFIEGAEAEERALNDDETAKFDEYEKEIKSIDATLAAEERARSLMVDDDSNNDHADDNTPDKTKSEERAFANYVRGIVEERADGTLTMSDNGAVIPKSIANRIISKTKEISPIFNDADIYNVKGTLSLPYYDEESGAVTMEYATEGVDGDATGGKFKSIDLTGHLARVITNISKSLINNSNFDITGYVVEKMSEAIALFLEKELLVGTAGKVEGLSKLTNTVTAASATAVTSDELIDLQESVPDRYQANAYWIMNKATRTAIRKLKDGQGNYLLNKDANARWGYTLFGKDVYISDTVPAMAAGKRVIYYGDYKGLAVKISEDINIEILRETKARLHLLEAVGFVEFDAKVQNAEMIAALDMKSAS